jgi:mannose-6-phosphate isomerase-like protein (cupin superfamily)
VEKINLAERFARFSEHWSPKIVGSLNNPPNPAPRTAAPAGPPTPYDIKIAKVQGDFRWHAHDDTDELFLVVDGRLRIALEGRDDVLLEPGEVFVVPRGVQHRPSAEVETQILMLEPRGTTNTGDESGTTGEALS